MAAPRSLAVDVVERSLAELDRPRMPHSSERGRRGGANRRAGIVAHLHDFLADAAASPSASPAAAAVSSAIWRSSSASLSTPAQQRRRVGLRSQRESQAQNSGAGYSCPPRWPHLAAIARSSSSSAGVMSRSDSAAAERRPIGCETSAAQASGRFAPLARFAPIERATAQWRRCIG